MIEDEASDGKIKNGATIRTTLALRHVLLSSKKSVKHLERDKVRIVLQLTEQVRCTILHHTRHTLRKFGDQSIAPPVLPIHNMVAS